MRDPSVEDEGQKPDWEVAWGAEQREVLAGAYFSGFAPEGLRAQLGGWGWGEGEPVQSVALRHQPGEDRWIEVDSEISEDEFYLRVDGVDRLLRSPRPAIGGSRRLCRRGGHHRSGTRDGR